MNWKYPFAQRTALLRRNAVRELLKVTSQPEIISFAGGLPAAELFPMDLVKTAFVRVIQRTGGGCLQYAETEGMTPEHARAGIAQDRIITSIVRSSRARRSNRRPEPAGPMLGFIGDLTPMIRSALRRFFDQRQ